MAVAEPRGRSGRDGSGARLRYSDTVRGVASWVLGLGLLACGPSETTSDGGGGTGSTSQPEETSSSSSTTPGPVSADPPSTSAPPDTNDSSDHDCSTDCCQDAVVFTLEDGRETFELQFEVGGEILGGLVCPGGQSEIGSVSCNGSVATIDAGGGGVFNAALENTVRLDGGAPQAFGDELGFSGCDCNCAPQNGDITVLVDPTDTTSTTGSTGGSTSSTGG